MVKKNENKKTGTKKTTQKSSEKKSEFWVALQNQLLDFGTIALKKGIMDKELCLNVLSAMYALTGWWKQTRPPVFLQN